MVFLYLGLQRSKSSLAHTAMFLAATVSCLSYYSMATGLGVRLTNKQRSALDWFAQLCTRSNQPGQDQCQHVDHSSDHSTPEGGCSLVLPRLGRNNLKTRAH